MKYDETAVFGRTIVMVGVARPTLAARNRLGSA